jgi:predicted HTH domain antitoxin
MQLTLEIPEQYFIDYEQEQISALVKLSTALVQFQEGKISIGAACELAGVDRYTLIKMPSFRN